MKKWLSQIAFIASFVLTVSLSLLWLRSYSVADTAERSNFQYRTDSYSITDVALTSAAGQVGFKYSKDESQPSLLNVKMQIVLYKLGANGEHIPEAAAPSAPPPDRTTFTFQSPSIDQPVSSTGLPRSVSGFAFVRPRYATFGGWLTVPYWFLVLLAVIPPVRHVVRRIRNRNPAVTKLRAT